MLFVINYQIQSTSSYNIDKVDMLKTCQKSSWGKNKKIKINVLQKCQLNKKLSCVQIQIEKEVENIVIM